MKSTCTCSRRLYFIQSVSFSENETISKIFLRVCQTTTQVSHFNFKKKRGNFKNALIEKCKNIKNYPESLYFQDKHCTVLYDAYPKAKYHLLIVPNDLNLINFSTLNSNHKSLLEHMNQLADEIAKEIW
jgi:hypothetical protein